MAKATVGLTRQRLKTPRAAALAGITFALLSIAAQILIRLSIPTDSSDTGAWLSGQASTVSLALSLVPFAGIAFLWFMGVVRDRLGHREDQFFSTVFFGSGILYLGLTFVAAALAGSLLADTALQSNKTAGAIMYSFGRLAMYQISNVYALRMSGVFMISLGTIWLRTGAMPRWLAFVTYVLAVALLLTVSLSVWFTLIFPAWVFVISVFILVGNLSSRSVSAKNSRGPE
ncbi:MAG TPA: hypothetical protein VKB35_11775 [Ktedonobacteraceae bacterium]|nr:hypothetical protein [Ktedonobacteraceae bacterium]